MLQGLDSESPRESDLVVKAICRRVLSFGLGRTPVVKGERLFLGLSAIQN